MIDTSLNRVRVTTTATASLVRSGCGSHEPATKRFASGAQENLTNDGRRAFFYNGECQLVRVIVTNGVGSSTRSDFVYDGKLRRRVRIECSWSGSAWVTNTIVRYIYDGNLVVQERWLDPRISPSAVQQQVTYVRGRDLSGSAQGAGGIGGLLARTSFTTTGAQRATSYYHGDGNGNVTCLVNSNQLVVASYTYDPFGTILRQSGPIAEANLYRFSSKEWHEGSGLVYYLYRFYDPGLQRWLNRDPLGERGGANLYSFVVNQPTRFMDRWGLAPCGGDWGGYLWPPFQGPGLPSRGNCWRYACGDPAKPGETHRRRPPGWLNALQPSCPDPCKALMDGINGAGGKSSDPTSGKCPPGTHKISVQYASSAYGGPPDYHFARECPDGTWSDKPGQMEPKPISGPNETAPGYKKCGETCVPDNWDTDTIGSP